MSESNELKNDELESVAGGVEITPELVQKVVDCPGFDKKWLSHEGGWGSDFSMFLIKNFRKEFVSMVKQFPRQSDMFKLLKKN